MSRINLHPEHQDKRPLPPADRHFYIRLALSALLGGVIVVGAGTALGAFIDHQDDLNSQISTENGKLDQQLKEVAQLKQEIAALQARQRAVEELQEDRNTTTHLLDELTRQVPEGIFLRYLEQKDSGAIVYGYAQSNERVSEFMRNIDHHSAWLQKASLVEIRTVSNDSNSAMPLNHVFTFALEFTVAATPRKLDANNTVIPAEDNQQPAAGNKAQPSGTSAPSDDEDDEGDDDDGKDGDDDEDQASDNNSKDKEDAGNKGSGKDDGKASTDKGNGNKQGEKDNQEDGGDKDSDGGNVKQENTAGSGDGTAQPRARNQPAPPGGDPGQARQGQPPADKKAPAAAQDTPATGEQDSAGTSSASQQKGVPAANDSKAAGSSAAGTEGNTPDPRDGEPATSDDADTNSDAGQP